MSASEPTNRAAQLAEQAVGKLPPLPPAPKGVRAIRQLRPLKSLGMGELRKLAEDLIDEREAAEQNYQRHLQAYKDLMLKELAHQQTAHEERARVAEEARDSVLDAMVEETGERERALLADRDGQLARMRALAEERALVLAEAQAGREASLHRAGELRAANRLLAGVIIIGQLAWLIALVLGWLK